MTVLVPVISVDNDNKLIQALMSIIRQKKSLRRINSMRLYEQLAVKINLKSAANSRCLKIKSSVDIFGRENNCRPVNSDLILIAVYRLEQKFVGNALNLTFAVVDKTFGIVVKEIVRQSVSFTLPCRWTVDQIPFGIVKRSRLESERQL